MKPVLSHPWQVTLEEALNIQEELRKKICLQGRLNLSKIGKIGAVDVAYKNEKAIAGVCIFSYPDLSITKESFSIREVNFPYIPGFLSFREGPCIIEALEKINEDVDILLFDGQGIAHPRRMGIATHLGIYFGIASVGCAKKRLSGNHEPLENKEGVIKPLYDGGEMIGYAVRVKKNTRPLYISPGNLIDFETALKVIISVCRGYKIPEPLRIAHIFVNKLKKVV